MNPFRSPIIAGVGAVAVMLWTVVAVGFIVGWWDDGAHAHAVLLTVAAVAGCATSTTVLLLALRAFARQFIVAGRVYSEAYQSGHENGRVVGLGEAAQEAPPKVDLRLAQQAQHVQRMQREG